MHDGASTHFTLAVRNFLCLPHTDKEASYRIRQP